jgi:hypothetical protein
MNCKNKKGFVGIVFIFLLVVVVIGFTIYKSSQSSQPSTSGNAVNDNYFTSQQRTDCGDYGLSCCPGDYPCSRGECQAGMCIHCSFLGEPCCYNDVANIQCESGSQCIQGYCTVTDSLTNDCGHAGLYACQAVGWPDYCQTGVLDSRLGICLACGDYEQPCCQSTDYPCDYDGQCKNGICKKLNSQAPSTNAGSAPSTAANNNYNTPTSTSECGYLDEPCCQDASRLSPMGALSAAPPCYSGLSCIGDVCLEGPSYDAYSN